MKIKIYQINMQRDTENYAFLSYDSIPKFHAHTEPKSSIYDLVYDNTVDCKNLEDVYQMFNINRPPEFTGRSLSKSDVVEVIESENVEKGFYYVDTFGFQKVEFNPEETIKKQVDKIKVVIVEPGKLARITEIEDNVKAMQHAVRGSIQAIYPFEDQVALVYNDTGKLQEMPPNRALYSNGNVCDIIVGDFFICGTSTEKNKLVGLSDDLAKTYLERFKKPERFYKVGDTITAVKYNPQNRDCR